VEAPAMRAALGKGLGKIFAEAVMKAKSLKQKV
jgi:hypothetical protein